MRISDWSSDVCSSDLFAICTAPWRSPWENSPSGALPRPAAQSRVDPRADFGSDPLLSDRRSFQSFHPFATLSRLLDSHPAGAARPLLLSIGQPETHPPGFIPEATPAPPGTWESYPPQRARGTHKPE